MAHPFLPAGIPYGDLIGGSWRTFVTGATGTPGPEAASLRLAGFQAGFSVFTTLTVERLNNTTVTPNVWQETALADDTLVWQTTDSGDGFCLQTGPLCTFAQFKAQYPTGRFTAVQVAIGTGVPAVTSYADGVSVTFMEDGTEVTDTFDFDVAAARNADADRRPAQSCACYLDAECRGPSQYEHQHAELSGRRGRGYRAWIARPAVGSDRRDRAEAPPERVRAAGRRSL